MSKLGSAPPPPPYKVPLSERLFGINKLKPPSTENVPSADLLSTVRLGAFSLELDERGAWQMDSRLEAMYRNQITALEAKVAQLEDERLDRNVYELEKRNIALEREKLQMMDEMQQLKFKNKVLMAMCTISEGDYKALCKEAGIEPRSQKKPAPTPAHFQQSQQQQPPQQSFAQQPQPTPSNSGAYNPAPTPANQQPYAAAPYSTTNQSLPSAR